MINLQVPADGSALPIRSVPMWQFWLLGVSFLAFAYAVYARHWSYFLLFAPLCGIPAAVGSYLAIGLRMKRGEKPKYLWLALVGPLLLMTLVGLMYYSVFVGAKDIFLWVDPKLTSSVWRAVFIGFAVALVGSALYWFRVNFRFTYGFHEVAAGIGIAAYHAYKASGVPSSWDSGIYLALVTAGVYLVVRGFDNMHVGVTKEPYDTVGRDIFRDYFDKKEKPGMVDIHFYPSDLFFLTLPSFPTPTTPAEAPLPPGFSPLPVIDGRASR